MLNIRMAIRWMNGNSNQSPTKKNLSRRKRYEDRLKLTGDQRRIMKSSVGALKEQKTMFL